MPKQITLDFAYFLDLSIGNFDRIAIKPELADLIRALDPDESLCHVEFPNADNKLKQPVLWWIKPWKCAYEKWCRDKAESALRRRRAVVFSANRETIARAMSRKFGIDKELCLGAAHRIAERLDHKAAENLGTKLEIP